MTCIRRKALPWRERPGIYCSHRLLSAFGVRVDQQILKQKVAEAAFARVTAYHSDHLLLGIGTGTTAE